MKDDSVFVSHISEAIRTIESYIGNATHDDFIANGMLQDAVVRQLEIVGEASRNLSDETRNKFTEIPWGQIIGMRNRLIHAYFQVDVELVWDIVCNDLPELRRQLEQG